MMVAKIFGKVFRLAFAMLASMVVYLLIAMFPADFGDAMLQCFAIAIFTTVAAAAVFWGEIPE